jgi:hypothetical protein
MSIKYQVIDALSAADVASNQTSPTIDIRFNYGYAVVCTFTGAPTGTVLIRGSIDGTTWITLDTLTVSGTTTLAVNRSDVFYPYLSVYKASGGTGTVTAKICIKGV